jgi:hypothetical protein
MWDTYFSCILLICQFQKKFCIKAAELNIYILSRNNYFGVILKKLFKFKVSCKTGYNEPTQTKIVHAQQLLAHTLQYQIPSKSVGICGWTDMLNHWFILFIPCTLTHIG